MPPIQRKAIHQQQLRAGGYNVYTANFVKQYMILLDRAIKSYIRNPGNALARVSEDIYIYRYTYIYMSTERCQPAFLS